MASLKRVVRQYFYTILLLVTAGGFVMIAAELLLTGHTEGLQMVGVIASVVGLILAALALFVSSLQVRNVLAILFIVLSISGLMGVLQHAEAGGEGGEAFLNGADAAGYQAVSLRSQEEEEGEGEGRGGESEAVPPPLAPLSLSGLALLGAIVVLGMPEPQAAEVQAAKPATRSAAKPRR